MPIGPNTRIVDISLTLSADFPVWPGDDPIALAPMSRIADGASSNVTRIAMPSHCVTHVDPPNHFIADGATLDQIPIERWVGPCQVIAIDESVARIEPEHLEAAGIHPETSRLLIKTRNSRHWHISPITFDTSYVALSQPAARWLVARGMTLIGVDALSFEPFDDEEGAVHRIVLGAGMLAIEGLDLTGVDAGFYDLVCLPLKIQGGDGAPARVILMSEHAGV